MTTSTPTRSEPAKLTEPTGLTAVIVGASLSGLATALALSRVGATVTLLERVDDFARTGAALGSVDNDLIDQLTGQDDGGRNGDANLTVQTWAAVHRRLQEAVTRDPRIEVMRGTRVDSVDQDADSAWATTSSGVTWRADLVIGADGHRSVVRRAVSADHPHATFAGYVLWVGLSAAPATIQRHQWPRGIEILPADDSYLFGYPLPGDDGSNSPGRRQLGWGWFDSSRNQLFRDCGAVTGDIVQHSLRNGAIPDGVLEGLAADARIRWPDPWRGAILDSIARRAVTGLPIAEYVPNRMAKGRLALVGDAAHVPTPMTGSGFRTSVDDALALARSVACICHTSDLPLALRTYEDERLTSAQAMVQGGRQFSEQFGRRQ